MPDAIEIHEIGSEGFESLRERLRARGGGAGLDLGDGPEKLLERARATGDNEFIEFAEKFYQGLESTASATVDRVIQSVREGGDNAVRHFCRLFEGKELTTPRIKVSKLDLMKAADGVDEELLRICRDHILPRLRAFHERQKEESWSIEEHGGSTGVRVQPLLRVGLYIPGGTATYPSTLMMTAVPALVAGVAEICVFMPQGALEGNPLLAALILELGIDQVFRVGGAQAIAAAAIGTEVIERVDKIVGPGNLYVALAKKAVFGLIGIDSFSGPSEIVVVFDEQADPALVAADLLSQAEHDAHAAAIGITDDEEAAKAVQAEVESQLAELERKGIAAASLKIYGGIMVAPSMGFALRIADSLAPEHLELLTENAEQDAKLIRNAGAIFVGPWAPEAFGDYCAGPNHVLPTAGTARWASALSVADFTRKISIIKGSEELLAANRDAIVKLARAEGLSAHARAVEKRF